MKLPEYVIELIHQLNTHGYECYVVGGAVRSYLLNEEPHDYDLTTNAFPDEMKQVFSSYHSFDTGIEHGTITVLSHHHPVEITTYRQDGDYLDHRHPASVTFTRSLKEDLKRRDFTINAMCYHPDTGLIDYFGGKEDLKNEIIRCIGDPNKRFEEDALRILRALRFSSRLGFQIEDHTLQTMYTLKDTLSFVSIERINQEFTGILSSTYASETLSNHLEIISTFIPELKLIPTDEYQQIISFIQNDTTCNPILRMALLLSKIDNPKHILKTLKYSNDFIKSCMDLIRHTKDTFDTPITLRLLLNTLSIDFSTFLNYQKAMHPDIDIYYYTSLFEKVNHDDYCYCLKNLQVTGKDVMQLGYKGKEIGEILNTLLTKVIHEQLPNSKEILLSSINN